MWDDEIPSFTDSVRQRATTVFAGLRRHLPAPSREPTVATSFNLLPGAALCPKNGRVGEQRLLLVAYWRKTQQDEAAPRTLNVNGTPLSDADDIGTAPSEPETSPATRGDEATPDDTAGHGESGDAWVPASVLFATPTPKSTTAAPMQAIAGQPEAAAAPAGEPAGETLTTPLVEPTATTSAANDIQTLEPVLTADHNLEIPAIIAEAADAETLEPLVHAREAGAPSVGLIADASPVEMPSVIAEAADSDGPEWDPDLFLADVPAADGAELTAERTAGDDGAEPAAPLADESAQPAGMVGDDSGTPADALESPPEPVDAAPAAPPALIMTAGDDDGIEMPVMTVAPSELPDMAADASLQLDGRELEADVVGIEMPAVMAESADLPELLVNFEDTSEEPADHVSLADMPAEFSTAADHEHPAWGWDAPALPDDPVGSEDAETLDDERVAQAYEACLATAGESFTVPESSAPPGLDVPDEEPAYAPDPSELLPVAETFETPAIAGPDDETDDQFIEPDLPDLAPADGAFAGVSAAGMLGFDELAVDESDADSWEAAAARLDRVPLDEVTQGARQAKVIPMPVARPKGLASIPALEDFLRCAQARRREVATESVA